MIIFSEEYNTPSISKRCARVTSQLFLYNLSLSWLVPNITSLQPAQNVDPNEGASADVDNSGSRWHKDEVDGLGRKPEDAGCLECGDELLFELGEDVFLTLHYAHAWNK